MPTRYITLTVLLCLGAFGTLLITGCNRLDPAQVYPSLGPSTLGGPATGVEIPGCTYYRLKPSDNGRRRVEEICPDRTASDYITGTGTPGDPAHISSETAGATE
jgi:hypothetical protein